MLSEHEAALSAEAEAGLLNNNVGAVSEFPVLQLPALPHHHLGTHSQRALVSPEVSCLGCYLHIPANWCGMFGKTALIGIYPRVVAGSCIIQFAILAGRSSV